MNKIIKVFICGALYFLLSAVVAIGKIESRLRSAAKQHPEFNIQNIRKNILLHQVDCDMTFGSDEVIASVQKAWFSNDITIQVSGGKWDIGLGDFGYDNCHMSINSTKSISIAFKGVAFKRHDGSNALNIDMLEMVPSNFDDFIQRLSNQLTEEGAFSEAAENISSKLAAHKKESESDSGSMVAELKEDNDLSVDIRATGIKFMNEDSKMPTTSVSIEDIHMQYNLDLPYQWVDAKLISIQYGDTDLSLDKVAINPVIPDNDSAPLSLKAEYKNLMINQLCKKHEKYLMANMNIDFNQDMKGPYNMSLEVDINNIDNLMQVYLFQRSLTDSTASFKVVVDNPVFSSNTEGSMLVKSILSDDKFAEFKYHSETNIKNKKVWNEGLKFAKQNLPRSKKSNYTPSINELLMYIITDVKDNEHQTRDISYKLTYNSATREEATVHIQDRIKTVDANAEENIFSTNVEIPNKLKFLKARSNNSKRLVCLKNGTVINRRKASFQKEQADLCSRIQSNNPALIGSIGLADENECSDPITYEMYQLRKRA